MADESTETVAESTPAEPVPFAPSASGDAAEFAALKARVAASADAQRASNQDPNDAGKERAQARKAQLGKQQSEPAADTESTGDDAPEKPEDAAAQKPPSNLGGMRKAFFQRQQAERAAKEAAAAEQSVAAKAAKLEQDLADAKAYQEKQRELFKSGKFDEAIKYAGVEGLDSVEALQRRLLEHSEVVPRNDPQLAEMREELAALKKAHAERIESEQRASARAREEVEARQLLAEVKANSDSHPDPAIQMLSKVPGFNEQVFQAIMRYPQHDEAKIYATVANGFSQLIADLEAAGLVSRNGAGNTAKVPAQASAKPEARSNAGKPDKPARRVATISTQSAEPATPEPWDPRKDAEAWERHKRKRYG